MDARNWPDAARPGFPADPNRQHTWHWIKTDAGNWLACYWVDEAWTTAVGGGFALSPGSVADWTYGGPAMLPDEAAAYGLLYGAASTLAASLDGGFVACQRCGDQEATADMDFVPEFLAAVKAVEVIGPRRERRGIYVASRASVVARGAMWRDLRAAGWPITSTWIDEDGEGATADFGELWSRIQDEVTLAAALILYAEPDDLPLKGAFIEVGMALAAGVPVFAVLPGITLEPRSMRPVGSWLAHPLVKIMPDLPAALAAARGAQR